MNDLFELTSVLAELRDKLPDAKERRRYALLQAAVELLPEALRRGPAVETSQLFGSATRFAVDVAESLLAEIEKREKAEAES